MADYTIYGSPESLFTRKFEAALIFYGVSFECRRKRGSGLEKEVEKRAGTHQIPILLTPENWMIADTTPMMMLLDSRYPGRAMFPPASEGVLVHLIEEFLDEWVARVMVHYRWNYPDSAAFASRQIANDDEAVAQNIRAWGPRACRATGVGTPELGLAAEAEYQQLLQAAEQQLTQTRFLMGDRPTAVDYAFLGGLRAHILNDPDPKKTIGAYPVLVQWCNGANSWDGQGAVNSITELTDFAGQALGEMARSYKPFLLANALAIRKSEKSFEVTTHGIETSYLARPYPEQSRQMINTRIRNCLGLAERTAVVKLLKIFELEECFEC